jgi:hypothetical protein
VYEAYLRRRPTINPLTVTYAEIVNCCHAGAYNQFDVSTRAEA